jgi:hypothetical protein
MATDQTYSADDPSIVTSEMNGAHLHWPQSGEEAFWHASAPGGARRHYGSGDAAGGWKRWRRHLLGRGNARLAEEFAAKLVGSRKRAGGALLWGTLGTRQEQPRLAWLLKLADARPRRARELATEAPAHIENWLAETADLQNWSPTSDDALEAVAWARALPPLVRVCSGELWWQLLERLHHLAGIATVPLDDDPLAHQLACGELPRSLAALFSEIEPCRQLAPAAAKALSTGIAELLDGTGVPQCRFLSIFHRLVAIWTRSRLLAAAAKSLSAGSDVGDCWDADAEQEFPQAVREALRLSRYDGTPVMAQRGEADGVPLKTGGTQWLADVAVGLAGRGDKSYRRAMYAIATGRGSKAKGHAKSKRPIKGMPDPAFNSEWAELAVLQTDWSARATRLTVAYSGPTVRIELQSDRELLLGGTWELEVRAGGVLAQPRGSWSEVCWVSDADCDYLELELELSGSMRVQRQILLSRKDQFVFLADAMLGADAAPSAAPSELAYRGRLPLAAGITVRPAAETRELTLFGTKPRAVVLPLALPEWQADPRGGTLSGSDANPATASETNGKHVAANGAATNGAATNGAATDAIFDTTAEIVLTQAVQGRRMFAPLWIDLSGKRVRKHDRDLLTWRQLTVGEHRQILPRDVAVGYRVQCGKRQWIAYRSLTAPANRTLIGVNLSTDFFVGRFGSDGETESIVEVE